MNIFTRLRLFLLKKKLNARNISRVGWGNYIKLQKDSVIKISGSKTRFEQQILNYLITYYKNVLKLGFDAQFDTCTNEIMVISPLVNLSLLSYILPKKYLFKETKRILSTFANSSVCTLQYLKQKNPIIDKFEIYCADLNPGNFFHYKSKFYLLDIEDFYFIMYDKEGNKIKAEKLCKEDQNFLIKYQERLRADCKDPRKTKVPDAEYCYIMAY